MDFVLGFAPLRRVKAPDSGTNNLQRVFSTLSKYFKVKLDVFLKVQWA